MNKSILLGRLTKDPELRTTATGVNVCSFTIAVNRRFKNATGEYETDFINCVAWRQQADFLCKYFSKGSALALVGSIQTRSYEDADGKRVYVTEVAADEIHFAGDKKKTEQNGAQAFPDIPGFEPVGAADDDLPY